MEAMTKGLRMYVNTQSDEIKPLNTLHGSYYDADVIIEGAQSGYNYKMKLSDLKFIGIFKSIKDIQDLQFGDVFIVYDIHNKPHLDMYIYYWQFLYTYCSKEYDCTLKELDEALSDSEITRKMLSVITLDYQKNHNYYNDNVPYSHFVLISIENLFTKDEAKYQGQTKINFHECTVRSLFGRRMYAYNNDLLIYRGSGEYLSIRYDNTRKKKNKNFGDTMENVTNVVESPYSLNTDKKIREHFSKYFDLKETCIAVDTSYGVSMNPNVYILNQFGLYSIKMRDLRFKGVYKDINNIDILQPGDIFIIEDNLGFHLDVYINSKLFIYKYVNQFGSSLPDITVCNNETFAEIYDLSYDSLLIRKMSTSYTEDDIIKCHLSKKLYKSNDVLPLPGEIFIRDSVLVIYISKIMMFSFKMNNISTPDTTHNKLSKKEILDMNENNKKVQPENKFDVSKTPVKFDYQLNDIEYLREKISKLFDLRETYIAIDTSHVSRNPNIYVLNQFGIYGMTLNDLNFIGTFNDISDIPSLYPRDTFVISNGFEFFIDVYINSEIFIKKYRDKCINLPILGNNENKSKICNLSDDTDVLKNIASHSTSKDITICHLSKKTYGSINSLCSGEIIIGDDSKLYIYFEFKKNDLLHINDMMSVISKDNTDKNNENDIHAGKDSSPTNVVGLSYDEFESTDIDSPENSISDESADDIKNLNLITVIGPSNSGKDTIKKSLTRLIDQVASMKVKFNVVVNHTTRPARTDETYGVEYFFTDEKSLSEIDETRFLAMSEFTVADGSNWKYWIDLKDINFTKTNIIFCDPDMCKNIIDRGSPIEYDGKKFKITLYIMWLTLPLNIIAKRAFNRSYNEPLKDKETLRRINSDSAIFNTENLFNVFGDQCFYTVDASGPDAFCNFLLELNYIIANHISNTDF